MNLNGLGSGAAMSAYVNSILAKSQETSPENSQQTGASRTESALKTSTAAALSTVSRSAQAGAAQHRLGAQATALANQLRAAMTQAGVTLGGAVEFSLSAQGAIAVSGSDADQAAARAFLSNDKSSPGFASKIASLASDADAQSQVLRQSAAISQAARHAGNPGSVLSLYTSLLQRQDSTPAVFTLSPTGASLSYPGSLASKA